MVLFTPFDSPIPIFGWPTMSRSRTKKSRSFVKVKVIGSRQLFSIKLQNKVPNFKQSEGFVGFGLGYGKKRLGIG